MIVEIAIGSVSGILAYVLVQKFVDIRAGKTEAEKRERLDAADQLVKQSGYSYVWYDAEAGSNDDKVSDALLMVGTQTDRIVVDSTGHLVGRFSPTDSLYVAGSLEMRSASTAPKLRLVVNNENDNTNTT